VRNRYHARGEHPPPELVEIESSIWAIGRTAHEGVRRRRDDHERIRPELGREGDEDVPFRVSPQVFLVVDEVHGLDGALTRTRGSPADEVGQAIHEGCEKRDALREGIRLPRPAEPPRGWSVPCRVRALWLCYLLAGCVSASSAIPRPTEGEPTVPVATLPEPTRDTAGGRCRVVHDSLLGNATSGTTSSAFDARSGLAAWPHAGSLMVRPLTRDGRPSGPQQVLPVPYPTSLVVPWEEGFLIVAQERGVKAWVCPAKCVDAACRGWVGPGTLPHVCSHDCYRRCMVPGAVRLFAMRVTREGLPKSHTELLLGDHPVIAMAGPTRGPLAMVTAHGQLVEVTSSAGDVRLSVREAPPHEVLLPVRGQGPATFLVGDERTLDAVLTLDGERPLTRDDGVLGGITLLREGRLDARYNAGGRSSWPGGDGSTALSTSGTRRSRQTTSTTKGLAPRATSCRCARSRTT
jgi:hypothetical protein